MFALYTLLYLVGLCAYVPRALRRASRGGSLRARLGRVPRQLYEHRGAVWVHAVSVGEVHAARGLLPHLRSLLPGTAIVLSTTTATGQELAARAGADAHFYMPLDLPMALTPYLEVLQPRALILVETEIWPNLLRACRRRGVPVALANGRLSERSCRRYRTLLRVWPAPLAMLDLICARTRVEADRFRRLAIAGERIFVTGNLKADAAALTPPPGESARLGRELGLDGSAAVLVAGCTMPGEEQIILDAFQQLRARHPQLRLLLAPRHPERFDDAQRQVAEAGLTCRRRTDKGPPAPADVLLLDTIGELPAAYGLGTVSFVGGSLVATGGHNLLEPAVQRQPVLFGPHVDNFAAMARDFEAAGGGIRVADAADLARQVGALLEDPERRIAIGERARATALRDAVAGARTARVLRPVLGLAS